MIKATGIWLAVCAGVCLQAQQQTPKAPAKVVFVCEHGAAKSVIAAAEFERMAKERGLHFQIVSRGATPDLEIAPGVRQGLKADGMDVGATTKPTKVTATDLAAAARVVTFGPDLSGLLPKDSRVLDWSATPPPSKDYQASRNYIRSQLQTLLNDLEKQATPVK